MCPHLSEWACLDRHTGQFGFTAFWFVFGVFCLVFFLKARSISAQTHVFQISLRKGLLLFYSGILGSVF